MQRRTFSSHLLSLGALGMVPAAAWAQGGPIEGKHYQKLSTPVPTSSPGKIEVLEFFSYGCPHCAQFEPTLSAWAAKLPSDVVFKRVPVPFLANPANFQKTYYALEAMGLVETMQAKVFQAVHVDRQRLDSLEALQALMTKHGVDANKFAEQFKSFSVSTKAAQTRKLIEGYKIESVPMVGVNGLYVTDAAMAGGHPQTLAVVDALIQKIRTKS